MNTCYHFCQPTVRTRDETDEMLSVLCHTLECFLDMNCCEYYIVL